MLVAAAAMFSLLLIATGAVKMVRPQDAAHAIRQLRIPANDSFVRLLSAVEVIVGVGALTISSTTFRLAQMALYALFAAWVFAAIRSDVPLASCGCFGRPDTPPTLAHLFVNLMGVLISGGFLFGSAVLPSDPLSFVAAATVAAAGAWLAWALMAETGRLKELTR